MKTKILLGVFVFLGLISCEQSEPQFNQRVDDVLTFSGRKWDIKTGFNGPGPNHFTNHPNDVYIDDDGYLHLAVARRTFVDDDTTKTWFCTEVVSQDTFGYGTYVWTIQGNPVNIDRNIVLGLFTWDNNTFQEEANSEVDIEFSKWGVGKQEYTLQYGVQPISFGEFNEERVFKPQEDNSNWIGISTHAFTWTDTLITWQSWPGETYGNEDPVASWSFDLNNPPKRKYEGPNISDPIVIPAPGNTTNARMNLWLLTGNEGPFFPIRHEIIIRNFQFLPL